jgi:antitoxin VapB
MPLNITDWAAESLWASQPLPPKNPLRPPVRKAAEERLQRVRRQESRRSLASEIVEIGRRCAALPYLVARSADEIPGYDEHGLPH